MLCIGAAYAVMRCLSVRLFVRLSCSWILSKRAIVSTNFFSPSDSHTILVFPYQTSWRVECRWGRKKSRFETNIWLSDRWLLKCERCDGRPCSLPRRPQCITESHLSEPAAWTTTTTALRREQNLISVRSGKSEAKVTNNRRLRSTFRTIEATAHWQTRSIAELLVVLVSLRCIAQLGLIWITDLGPIYLTLSRN